MRTLFTLGAVALLMFSSDIVRSTDATWTELFLLTLILLAFAIYGVLDDILIVLRKR